METLQHTEIAVGATVTVTACDGVFMGNVTSVEDDGVHVGGKQFLFSDATVETFPRNLSDLPTFKPYRCHSGMTVGIMCKGTNLVKVEVLDNVSFQGVTFHNTSTVVPFYRLGERVIHIA